MQSTQKMEPQKPGDMPSQLTSCVYYTLFMMLCRSIGLNIIFMVYIFSSYFKNPSYHNIMKIFPLISFRHLPVFQLKFCC